MTSQRTPHLTFLDMKRRHISILSHIQCMHIWDFCKKKRPQWSHSDLTSFTSDHQNLLNQIHHGVKVKVYAMFEEIPSRCSRDIAFTRAGSTDRQTTWKHKASGLGRRLHAARRRKCCSLLLFASAEILTQLCHMWSYNGPRRRLSCCLFLLYG